MMLMQLIRDHIESGFQATVSLASLNTTNIWDSYSMMISQASQNLGNYKLVHLTTTSGDSHQGKFFGYSFIRPESFIFLCRGHLCVFSFLFVIDFFSQIVTSFCLCMFLPILLVFFGGVSFSKMKVLLAR